MQIMETWWPETGDYREWIEDHRLRLLSQNYQILEEKTGLTFTGGEWVLFTIAKK